jgi:cell division septal protein FtsQ
MVNHHKFVKSFNRTADKTERFFGKFFKRKQHKKIKDYTWKGTQYNPYRKEDNSGKRKTIIKLSVLAITILGFGYVVIFSGLFDITDITVEGNEKISSEEIIEVINKTLEYKSLGFIPNASFFVANIEDLVAVLKGRFPIESVVVEKKFPHDLHVRIDEKILAIVYGNSSLYGLAGLDGSVIERIRAVETHEWQDVMGDVVTTTAEGVTTTLSVVRERIHIPDIASIEREMGEYAIVYDKRGRDIDKGLQVLTPEEVKTTIEWYHRLKNTEFGMQYLTIENTMDFIVTTKEGWIIRSRFARTAVEKQIKELELALEKIENRRSIQYIDLRYENRIYWK